MALEEEVGAVVVARVGAVLAVEHEVGVLVGLGLRGLDVRSATPAAAAGRRRRSRSTAPRRCRSRASSSPAPRPTRRAAARARSDSQSRSPSGWQTGRPSARAAARPSRRPRRERLRPRPQRRRRPGDSCVFSWSPLLVVRLHSPIDSKLGSGGERVGHDPVSVRLRGSAEGIQTHGLGSGAWLFLLVGTAVLAATSPALAAGASGEAPRPS